MFMESFKYYKSKNPPPDLKDVLNFNDKSADGSYKVCSLNFIWLSSIIS